MLLLPFPFLQSPTRAPFSTAPIKCSGTLVCKHCSQNQATVTAFPSSWTTPLT